VPGRRSARHSAVVEQALDRYGNDPSRRSPRSFHRNRAERVRGRPDLPRPVTSNQDRFKDFSSTRIFTCRRLRTAVGSIFRNPGSRSDLPDLAGREDASTAAMSPMQS